MISYWKRKLDSLKNKGSSRLYDKKAGYTVHCHICLYGLDDNVGNDRSGWQDSRIVYTIAVRDRIADSRNQDEFLLFVSFCPCTRFSINFIFNIDFDLYIIQIY